MNPDGSDQKQITVDPVYIEELRSGGDGRYLVFSGYVDPARPHLYRINTDGSDMRQITFGDGREIDSSFSNDGKWLAYDSTRQKGTQFEHSLWKVPIDGGDPVSLHQTGCTMPHFSPDDKHISCVKAQKEIMILTSTEGAMIKTLTAPTGSTLNFGARWTPDGKAVAFIVSERGVSNIWIQPIDGSASRRLTDFAGGSIYHFAFSADRQRLFLARGIQIRDAILLTESD
jgi:Tol biopolymer transport system component